tara:strand:- start:4022 stop:5473 length:1452 start_codon:yes stop_codon:yes gene_type:complete
MAKKISTRATGPGNINKMLIKSNTDQNKTFDVTSLGAPVNFKYYESLLQDVIYASVTYVDPGNAVKPQGGDAKLTTAVTGLPITGSETVELSFQDVNDEEIAVTLLVNKVTEVMEDSGKTMVTLDMNSKELFDNDKIRLNTRLDGKISDHIETILTDPEYLETEKELHIEQTENNYNKIMNNKKPFYMMNYFSTLAVPGEGGDGGNASGNSAGYLLWETSEGFHFRSVDWLFNKEKNPKKKSIIYNETPDSDGANIPPGYDIKALAFEKDNRNDIKSKLDQGAYATRLITFNPFNCFYEVTYPNADNKPGDGGGDNKGSQKNLKLAGEKLPVLNPTIKSAKGNTNDFSRTTFKYLDVGTLPEGSGGESGEGADAEQIKKSEEENSNPAKILNQAIQRLNQVNNFKISITLPGDFTLHAGDTVFVDSPMLDAGKKTEQQTEVDNQSGGLYIIRDLCHYMSAESTYTKINVVRDSVGRKGSAENG